MTIVDTGQGALEGGPWNGVVRFAGIPYAAPPVGPSRFRPPGPPVRWSGVRAATRHGPVSLQNEGPLQAALGAGTPNQSEDCLTLSVHTPAADSGRRPVLVWIHGGGFLTGFGSSPLHDGSRLAARGDVVVVSVNYRLGVAGFLHLGELDPALSSSGLNGILDQIAALHWVRDNIAAFGGDPLNVTVFGASAGAMSIGALLVMPAARGLFRRAILQSGAAESAFDRDLGAARARRFCQLAACSTVADLEALTPSQLLRAQAMLDAEVQNVHSDERGWGSELSFAPVVDGEHLPALPIELALGGSLAEVDLLLGTTEQEWRLFSARTPAPASDAELVARLDALVVEPVAVIARYRTHLGRQATTKDVFDAVLTDIHFRLPARRLADAAVAAGRRVWMYRFGYPSPAMDGGLGSCHGLEVPFVFDNRDGPITMLVGESSPAELAGAMQCSWVNFARSGDPNHEGIPRWEPMSASTSPFLRFDRVTTANVDQGTGPEPALRAD